jgi:surface antigen
MFRRIISVVSLFLFGQTTYAQSPSYVWHEMFSQSQRNSAIVHRAQMHIGDYGGQCKVFVQEVVWEASNGVVWLPQNHPSRLHRWKSSPDVRRVSTDSCRNLKPGQIIQAELRARGGGSLPHTMIVEQFSSNSITVIESNYQNDGRVRRRTTSRSRFMDGIIHMTVYEVR